MNVRSTWRWITVAAVLVAFIFVHHRYLRKTSVGVVKVLPNLNDAAVTSVQVRPAAQMEIRAERTNGIWRLTEPITYPAQGTSIDALLSSLERLTPAPYITARELRGRLKTDEEYGFATPRAFLIIEQPGYTARLRVGSKTAPGDQVFLQVIGVEGVYVVDAAFLKHLPQTADDWRDTALIDLRGLAFDRLAVTNGAKIFDLRRDGTNKLWRMVYPLQARAHNAKAEESLEMLRGVRVRQFLPEDAGTDLEGFGLQPPELEVALGLGTNPVARLQFGRTLTNDTRLVYARRLGLSAIVAVPKDLLAPWYAPVNDFRDPSLVTLTAPAGVIEVHGPDNFSLVRQTNETWRVLPQDFPADPGLVKELLAALSGLQIVEFTKDVVIPPDLPGYGLAPPAQQYVVKSLASDSPVGRTNTIIAQVDFGTNQADKVFARRADEGSVYAVRFADFQRLPTASWELRERRVWSFSTNDVARVTIRQQGRVLQMVRNGPYDWSLAVGSQGTLKNALAVEETVRGLCQLTAVAWVACGDQNRARYGFAGDGQRVTVELKNGAPPVSVEFSSRASPNSPYAAVTLDGRLWIFQFPTWLYDYVQRYLAVPPSP